MEVIGVLDRATRNIRLRASEPITASPTGMYVVVSKDGSFHTNCKVKMTYFSDFFQILSKASYGYKIVSCKF